MKYASSLFLLFLVACNSTDQPASGTSAADTSNKAVRQPVPPPAELDTATGTAGLLQDRFYANERFRNVTVEKLGGNSFRVSGQAQIFEARFGWMIEDGHNQLAEGYESTDAGAPEWGKFSFTVKAKKVRPESTLHLILFESSAKDGSRQHQLPVPLN